VGVIELTFIYENNFSVRYNSTEPDH